MAARKREIGGPTAPGAAESSSAPVATVNVASPPIRGGSHAQTGRRHENRKILRL